MNTVKQWMRATRALGFALVLVVEPASAMVIAESLRADAPAGRAGQHLVVLRQRGQPEPDRLQRVIQRFSAPAPPPAAARAPVSRLAIRAIASSSQPPARSGMPRRTADVIHSDHGRRSARPLRSLSMSTEGTARSPLILADGYSSHRTVHSRAGQPVRLHPHLHAFFSPQEETPSPRWRRTTRRSPHRNRAEDRHHAQPGSHSTVPPTDAGCGRHGLRHAGSGARRPSSRSPMAIASSTCVA